MSTRPSARRSSCTSDWLLQPQELPVFFFSLLVISTNPMAARIQRGGAFDGTAPHQLESGSAMHLGKWSPVESSVTAVDWCPG